MRRTRQWPVRPGPAGGPFAWLLSLLVPFTARMALAVLLGVATVGSSIGLMATAAYLLSAAALHPSIAELQVAVVGVRFFGIARAASRYLERLVSHDVTFRLLARLRVQFFQALEPLAPARLVRYRSGDLLARIGSDVETLQDLFLRAVAPPAVAVVVAVMTALLVAWFHPSLVVPALVGLALAGAGIPAMAWALSRSAGRSAVRVRSELNAGLVDAIQGLPDLLAFGGEAAALERLQVQGRKLQAAQGRLAHVGGLSTALVGLVTNLATLAVLVTAIPLVRGGQVDGVYLALLALAVAASFEAVAPVPQALQTLEGSLEAGRRLWEVVAVPPPGGAGTGVVPTLPAPAERTGGGEAPRPLAIAGPVELRAEELRFAYEAGQPPALDGVSLEVRPGRVLAVVGPSGAGKSTLLHLLLRTWEVQEGRIVVNGADLHLYGPAEWRRLAAVVPQSTHLFNDTVRHNLLLARPEASEEEMVDAARLAQIHEFIESLPQGYDTWIGEQGLRLSGGQRQRLAIARAILKGAPLLILDEPTANLDAQTEREVLDALRAAQAGRTTVIASHRLVGLEEADEIVVLDRGRIVERGRHDELLERPTLYRRMWELQTQVLG